MTTLSSQSRRSINNNNNNSTSTQMPKLLHAFCCCLRPNPLNEKNDCRSTSNINNNNNNNNIYDSSNNRNILQSSKNGSSSQPINKTTQQLAGDLRQRLNPSTKKENKKYGFNFNNIIGNGSKSQSQQQQQKRMATQITVDGSTCNNNLISSNNNCSTNNTSNICIDGPFIGNENQKDLQNSTSNWSSQNLQQQNNSTCSSSPRVQQQQLPLAVAPLLSNPLHRDKHKKCLILDLDETLVHSSFKPVKNADFVIPIEIDNVVHQVYVLKRPHTDHFLERVGSLFECVLFTASLSKYADPVADLLDRKQVFRFRLFREACVFFEGNYVKDLEKLGRDLRKVIIIDNSPASYAFHPNNSLPIRTWFDDPNDTELLDLLPILEELSRVEDIYSLIGTFPPSSINLQQQQQRYQQQQQQQRLQQYSSPYYSTSTSSMMSSGGPSSIITQATMPSDVNNNNQLFSSLSITNEDDVLNDQLKQQQPKQKFSSSSSIYIQMGNDENNNKKKEDERLRRRNLSSTSNGSTSVTSPIYEQQQQSFNNNNNTSINSNYYSTSSTSRPSTSFGGKKWK